MNRLTDHNKPVNVVSNPCAHYTVGSATVEHRASVVMLTHNRVDEVVASLERLVALPERPRIVVVDNGSTDGTGAVVSRRFPDVDLLRSEHNLGAAARNVGIRHVRTPYVALCDDDTWWAPGAIRRAADLLDRHARLAVITGRVLVRSEEREDPTCARMAASPFPSASGMPGSTVLGFLAGASMIRRSAFLQVGGFEPRLFIGGEETLVAVDLATAGWTMAYVPDVIVYHYPSSKRDSHARRLLLLRNELWITWLRRPLGAALRRTVQLVRSVRHDPELRPALIQALAGLRWVWRHRRVIPPQVEAALNRLESDPQPY